MARPAWGKCVPPRLGVVRCKLCGGGRDLCGALSSSLGCGVSWKRQGEGSREASCLGFSRTSQRSCSALSLQACLFQTRVEPIEFYFITEDARLLSDFT